jgi:hypothetical protein
VESGGADGVDTVPLSDLSPISVHLLTCPPRAESCAATLARWDATDWGKAYGRPLIHQDDEPSELPWGDAAKHADVVRAFGRMLKEITAKTNAITAEAQRAQRNSFSPRPLRLCGESPPLGGEDWVLLLEDDLDFHPHLFHHVSRWPALLDDQCELATLFNPSLRPDPDYPLHPDRFAADRASFTGAQALLLRRRLIERALLRWDAPDLAGMQSRRLARIAAGPIWVHRPSLVQHVPTVVGSAWGARVQTALDFDPGWGDTGDEPRRREDTKGKTKD